jgi:hypothetical protein
MSVFAFQSRRGESVTPSEWLRSWSSEFDAVKFPEDVYQELVERGMELSDEEYNILGAWKDGALRHGTEVKFGNCSVSFTGSWRSDAVAAYTVWRNLPESRAVLKQYLGQKEYSAFLNHLAHLSYQKAGLYRNSQESTFGLSRATYILHVFSGGNFPIYDKNTHAGIYFLTQGRHGADKIVKTKRKDPDWYLGTFCPIIHELQEACVAVGRTPQRTVDKALFCYGKHRNKD